MLYNIILLISRAYTLTCPPCQRVVFCDLSSSFEKHIGSETRAASSPQKSNKNMRWSWPAATQNSHFVWELEGRTETTSARTHECLKHIHMLICVFLGLHYTACNKKILESACYTPRNCKTWGLVLATEICLLIYNYNVSPITMVYGIYNYSYWGL